MPEFENIVILVSDALRYDYMPESIARKGMIPTLAPSLHTPTSFASLFTARSPENHNVRGFMETLDPQLDTAFDYFENYSFYDGPNGGAIHKHIFQECVINDLDELEPPFIWIERMLQTHLPYGKLGHERNFNFEMSGWEYIEGMKCGEIDALEEYERGAREMEKYFQTVIQKLEEKDIMDETLVIVTSDHGELLGERFLGRNRYEHNYPPLQELVQVPTVFYNYDLDVECMRLIDLIPTALSLVGKESDLGDGVDITQEKVSEGRNIMDDPKAYFNTTWVFKDRIWKPKFSSRVQILAKTLFGDLKKYGYNHGGKHLKQKLERQADKEASDSITNEIDF